ncbi:MAG TPA: CPBP family intramembrane glutamic endopeptidase [Luteibacter sp.]|uniref:CPBP family intramembrane glutamic endopeptidase n=1 Tax=Luteibacter sp. TaxID=1886636 RepID=UPI002BD38D09|nr:CPBP family intramembrane glutamic endopeptidase [Luteibacter sp.]HVI54237.1 CPBP family intramembrane glutamic endopeptidase [Luteibacter sp.]
MPHDLSPASTPLDTSPSPPRFPARAPGTIETALTILAYFALQAGFGGAFGGTSQFIARTFPNAVPDQPDRLIVVVILTLLCAAGVVVTWIVRRWAAKTVDGGAGGLGFTAPSGRYVAIGTALGILAPLLGGLLTQFLAGDHDVSQTVTDIADRAHVGMRVALLPVVVVVGPLVEELLFRGALLSVLRTRLGDNWAIAISAIVFGAVHLPDLDWLWYAVPNLILVGVFCAWLRVRSGSIWPGFVAHAANNALAAAGWFMAT